MFMKNIFGGTFLKYFLFLGEGNFWRIFGFWGFWGFLGILEKREKKDSHQLY